MTPSMTILFIIFPENGIKLVSYFPPSSSGLTCPAKDENSTNCFWHNDGPQRRHIGSAWRCSNNNSAPCSRDGRICGGPDCHLHGFLKAPFVWHGGKRKGDYVTQRHTFQTYHLKVLMALVHAYMSPHTADNQGVRQCLSYFFPVYSYTSPTNQRQMQKVLHLTVFFLTPWLSLQIFLPALRSFFVEHKEYEDSDEMYSPLLVGSVLVDWTNSSKALYVALSPMNLTLTGP